MNADWSIQCFSHVKYNIVTNMMQINMHCNSWNCFINNAHTVCTAFVISIILYCFYWCIAFFCEPNDGIYFKIQQLVSTVSVSQSVYVVSGRDFQ